MACLAASGLARSLPNKLRPRQAPSSTTDAPDAQATICGDIVDDANQGKRVAGDESEGREVGRLQSRSCGRGNGATAVAESDFPWPASAFSLDVVDFSYLSRILTPERLSNILGFRRVRMFNQCTVQRCGRHAIRKVLERHDPVPKHARLPQEPSAGLPAASN